MTPFLPEQYIILALVFVLGLVLGMYLFSGGKWKRRYKDEARRREELETENKRLQQDAREMDSLRHSAARDEARHRTDHGDRPHDRGPL